ncbi:MAG TPA: hypothetical protein VEU47_16225 [Candidatus Cybelea sp.]|nr:hypothetical protein [Candidatus Cybelea sp.]
MTSARFVRAAQVRTSSSLGPGRGADLGSLLHRIGLRRAAIVLFLVAVICQSENFFAAISGLDDATGRQAFAGLMLLAALAYLVRMLTNPGMPHSRFALWPAIAFLVYIVTSAIANTFIFPKPLADWIWAQYILVPILGFYFFALLDVSERDLFLAVIVAGCFAAALLLADLSIQFPFMDAFARRSIFESGAHEVRRIVFLIDYINIAYLFLFTLLWKRGHSLGFYVLMGLWIAVMMYVQATVVQSRLSLMGMFFSIVILTLAHRPQRSYGTAAFTVLGIIAVFAAVPTLLGPYIALLFQDDLIVNNQYNVLVRIQTLQYYWDAFVQSGGFGFGMASPTGLVNNVISHGLNDLHLNFVDLGIVAGLVQFGVLGLAIVLGLTFLVLRILYRAFRRLPDPDCWRPAAIAAFIVGNLMSPIPINLFSIQSGVFEGSIVLYLCWRYLRVLRSAGVTPPKAPPRRYARVAMRRTLVR